MGLRSAAVGVCVLLATPSAGEDLIKVTGCARKGVTANCWVLESGGRTFSFTSNSVVADRCYSAEGKATMGFCMQGTQVALSKLEEAVADCCAASPAPSPTPTPTPSPTPTASPATASSGCVSFLTLADTTPRNPLSVGGARVEAFDHKLAPVAAHRIDSAGRLAVNRRLVIDLPTAAGAFSASVEVASAENEWAAFDATGKPVERVILHQGLRPHPALVLLVGEDIRRVVSTTRNSEGELMSFCWR